MPRRTRGWLDNACYHITHRCHNREFLFRYKKYRWFYLRQLFEMSKRYKIDILDYIVTSNHVHLLLSSGKGKRISEGLCYLHGRMGQFYNMETNKSGSFWSGRFHSTLIQDGKHLGECLFYIDLNMVRAGVVRHPMEWDASGCNEFYRPKQRYRIINTNRLLEVLAMPDIGSFRKWHTSTLDDIITREDPARLELWTKAYAIGEEEWLSCKLREAGIKRMKIKSSNGISFAIGENN